MKFIKNCLALLGALTLTYIGMIFIRVLNEHKNQK